MKLRYTTGNEIVDKMQKIVLTGNVVPLTWCETIHFPPNKRGVQKPYVNAILALSDIVYWYRPAEVRDESSGEFVGYRKRFKGEYLQRSYRSLAKRLGISIGQAKEAINHLVELGVVIKHIQKIERVGDTVLSNVLYLELVPERLFELTYPTEHRGWGVQTPYPSPFEHPTLVQSNVSPSMIESTTYTKNTSKNTIENNQSINHLLQEEDRIDTYTQIIKENISYDVLVQNCSYGDKEIIDELVKIMVDVVAIAREKIRIEKQEYPYVLVKQQFLKLEYEHIQYVLSCMKNNHTKIMNIKSYLRTALYNSLDTIDNYYRAEVNHDMYHFKTMI